VTVYDPTRCDLCGSPERDLLAELGPPAMTSDSRVVEAVLVKEECRRCGLVRSGSAFSEDALSDHYDAYALEEEPEPLVFTEHGPEPRSAVMAQWLDEIGLGEPSSVGEIGCGEGRLLERLATRFPDARVSGVDLSERAVERARSRGLDVRHAGYDGLDGQYDLLVSLAVVEHVPSPADYFRRLAERLTDDGLLVVGQPLPDADGFDLFFVDHLHHFHPDHLRALAAAAGLEEVGRWDGNPHAPAFGLQAYRRGSRDTSFVRAETGAADVLARWQAIFAEVDEWLRERQAIIVWGLGQTFVLLSAYTTLRDRKIIEALDDHPERYAGYPYAVVRPEKAFPQVPILVAFRPPAALDERLGALGLGIYTPLRP
jgi:SAM-dependent methyltransferase